MLYSSLEDLIPSWQILDPLIMEYNYVTKVNQTINLFNEDYQKFVLKYRKKSKRNIFTISTDYLEEKKNVINNNISLLKNAIELGRNSIKVSDNISPILLHYSYHCLMSFLNYSLFYWDNQHARGHGLGIRLKDDPSEITLTLHKRGTFKRSIDVFSLLGNSLVFSPWIPVFQNDKIEFIDNPNTLQDDKDEISINDLLVFDSSSWLQSVGLTEFEIIHTHGTGYKQINNIFISYVIVFMASNIARYRPSIWNEMLLGKTEFNVNFLRKYKRAIFLIGIGGFIAIVDRLVPIRNLNFKRRDGTKIELNDYL